MSNFKKQRFTCKFTQVPDQVTNDPNLSFKSKGLWLYLWSKPEGWNFCASRIAKTSKDGRDSVLSGMQELEDKGYIERKKLHTGKMEYTIFHTPQCQNATEGKSHSGKIPPRENPTHISNINSNQTEKEKTNRGGSEEKSESGLDEFLEHYEKVKPHDSSKINFISSSYHSLSDSEKDSLQDFLDEEEEKNRLREYAKENKPQFRKSAESFLSSRWWMELSPPKKPKESKEDRRARLKTMKTPDYFSL